MSDDPEELNRQHALRHHERLDRIEADNDKAAIDAGAIAVRTLVLVNGGAVVAMLAFLANVINEGSGDQYDGVLSSLTLFALGVFFAVGTAIGAYMTNLSAALRVAWTRRTWDYPYEKKTKQSKIWHRFSALFHYLSIGAGFTSLVLFLAGVLSLKQAMHALF